MKTIPILFLLIFPCWIIAQNPFQVTVETRTGFEYNVFNVNERQTILNEEDETVSALQSAYFQRFALQGTWTKKFNAHQFQLKSKLQFDYFPSLVAANLFRPSIAFNYNYKISKKQSLFFKTRYQGYQTNRIPGETDILLPPQTYQRIQADLGYKFQAFKNNKMQLQATGFRKIYQADEDSRLLYNAYQLSFQTKQRFKKKGKPARYLVLDINFVQRNYVDTPLELDEEEDDEEEERLIRYRHWQYHTAKLNYSLFRSKNLHARLGLVFQRRLDLLDQRFGYQQWQPFIKFSFERKRFQLDWKVEAVFRDFTHLKADRKTETLLRHQYLRSSLQLHYALKPQLDFVLQGNFRKRWRNLSETARSFLPYTNGMISVGIKYRFFRKTKTKKK